MRHICGRNVSWCICGKGLKYFPRTNYMKLLVKSTLQFLAIFFSFLPLGESILFANPNLERTNSNILFSSYYYEDKDSIESVESITKMEVIDRVLENSLKTNFITEKKFTPLNEGSLSVGFSRSTFWIKVDIDPTVRPGIYYFEVKFPPLDKVEFFYKENGKFYSALGGDSVREKFRDVTSRNIVFRYKLIERQSLFFKIKTNSTVYFPIKIWNEKEFNEKSFYEQFYMGAYFGIILVMILYNLFLYINIKEKLYLHYVIYVTSLFFFMLVDHGYASIFLWPENTSINNMMNPLLGQVAAIAAIFLTVNFLQISNELKLLKYVLGFFVTLLIFGIIGVFIIHYKYLLVYVNIVILIVTIVLILIAIREVFKKNIMSYYYLLAFGGFIIIVVYSLIANLGFIDQNFSSTYGMTLASTFEVCVISFALGYRINKLKQEKDYFESESKTTKHTYNLLKNEVKIAAKIQNSILPSHFPNTTGLVFEALYMPHGNVGGDFYDFIEINENEVGILVADVTGHGVPAALLASRANFSFTYEREHAKDPVTILQKMNKSLYNRMGKQFITAIYAYINTQTKVLYYSSCGHPPLIIFRSKTGEVFIEKPKGRMMGVFAHNDIELSSIKLETGDRILVFSDGVSDALGIGEDFKGFGNLVNALKEHSTKNLQELKKNIIKEIKSGEFRGDDSTLVLIDVI